MVKKILCGLLFMAVFLLSTSSVSALWAGYCGDLDAVDAGEITLGDAMFACNPNVDANQWYAGWKTVEESYDIMTNKEMRKNWIILDVRRQAEYTGDIPEVENQGHPMWVVNVIKKGPNAGKATYGHSYLDSWFGAGFTPNLDFWPRIQALEAAGVIDKATTNIIAMCRTSWRAHGAANFLTKQGYTVYNMGTGTWNFDGSMYGWYTHGLPTTCNTNSDPVIFPPGKNELTTCIIDPKYAGFEP